MWGDASIGAVCQMSRYLNGASLNDSCMGEANKSTMYNLYKQKYVFSCNGKKDGRCICIQTLNLKKYRFFRHRSFGTDK